MISGSYFLQKNVEGFRHLQEVLKKQPASMRQPVSHLRLESFLYMREKNSFNLMWAGVENYFDTLKKEPGSHLLCELFLLNLHPT